MCFLAHGWNCVRHIEQTRANKEQSNGDRHREMEKARTRQICVVVFLLVVNMEYGGKHDERWWLAGVFRKRNKIFYVTMGHDICDVIFHNFAFCVPHRISIQHASILPLLYHFSAQAIWDAPIKPNARDAALIRGAQRYWMIYMRTSP